MIGTLFFRTIMSPRLTSISSYMVSVMESPGIASYRLPSFVTIYLTLLLIREGRAWISPPALILPDATLPENHLKFWLERMTYCTGKRKSTMLCEDLTLT